MTVTTYQKTIIPQGLLGQQYAEYLECHLRDNGTFISRNEDTQAIVIEHVYHCIIEDITDGKIST